MSPVDLIPPFISIVCAHPPVRGQARRTRRKAAIESGAMRVFWKRDVMAETPSVFFGTAVPENNRVLRIPKE